MTRIVLALAVLLSVFAATAERAEAKLKFGADEQIHHIEDVTLKGAQGEPLFLGYKTTTQFFGAGVYLTDDGYVLGVKGEGKRYYPMPQGEELRGFQARGLLPAALPTYRIGWLDYLIGYSLYLVIIVVAAWTGIDVLRRRRKRRQAELAPA